MGERKLIMLVGYPRSGKTTWAKKQGCPIVNPDAVRLAIHGQAYVPNAERLVWAIVFYMVNALFLAGHDRVILDACNNTRKRRDDWENSSWFREFVVFEAPVEICLGRIPEGASNAEGLREAVKRMAEQYESVAEDEGPVVRTIGSSGFPKG